MLSSGSVPVEVVESKQLVVSSALEKPSPSLSSSWASSHRLSPSVSVGSSVESSGSVPQVASSASVHRALSGHLRIVWMT